MDQLRDAASEGRLTFEELADRIEAAGRAMTRDELAGLTADLPADPSSAAADGWGSPATAERSETPARVPDRRSAVFGDVRQAGVWRVPYVSRWSTVFGNVELDLREAVVSHARIEIEATSSFGNVTLLVPENVVVEVRARAGLGSVRQDAGLVARPGAPVVVLTGGTWFGSVTVRAPKRLRDRLAAALFGRLGT